MRGVQDGSQEPGGIRTRWMMVPLTEEWERIRFGLREGPQGCVFLYVKFEMSKRHLTGNVSK